MEFYMARDCIEDIKEHFLAGYNAVVIELRKKSNLYYDTEAFRVGYAQAIKELGWRNVEDELPAEDCKVYVACYNGVEYDTAIFKVKSRKFYTQAEEKQTKIGEKDDVGSYMIGGDCRQITEYYSKGVREDITAQVTHWMPIPKGGEV